MGVANIYSSLRGSSKALFSGGSKINSAVWGQAAGAKQQTSSARLSGIVLLLTTPGYGSTWPACGLGLVQPSIQPPSKQHWLEGLSSYICKKRGLLGRIESLTQNFINSRSVSPACLHSVRS